MVRVDERPARKHPESSRIAYSGLCQYRPENGETVFNKRALPQMTSGLLDIKKGQSDRLCLSYPRWTS